MDGCYFRCVLRCWMAHMWCVRRLKMPLRLKYKCTALLVTRTEVPKNFHLRQLINHVCFRSRLLLQSVFGWKKLVVLANSIPVATWTLSTWRDLMKIPRAFNRVCCLFVLCFVNVDGFIMSCVYFCFFGLKPLITPSSNSSCIAWYILLLYTNLKKCSNSVVSSNIQTRVPFSIVSSFCVWIFFTHTFAVCWTKSS